MFAQMHPAHATGFVEMRIEPFKPFAALPQQALSAGASNPPPIGINGGAGVGLSLPVAPPAVRFRDAAAPPDVDELGQRLIAVIPLVAHNLGEAGVGHHRELLGGGDEGLHHRRRVPVVGVLHRVTLTTAPVSRSTACSALGARCVRPSFSFVIFASGSFGCVQSSLDPFFLRFRSNRARSARVGVAIPDASASWVSHASYAAPVSRRTRLRIAALASRVVASIPIVCPWTRSASASRYNTQVNTA